MQASQAVCPLSGWKLPPWHGVHSDWRIVSVKDPGAHGVGMRGGDADKFYRALANKLVLLNEENAEWAHERKLLKYEDLKNEARDNGWNTRVYAVEVGCRGFASRSLRDFFTAIGSSNRKIKSTIEECCAAAERCSVQIYMKRKDRWSCKESES